MSRPAILGLLATIALAGCSLALDFDSVGNVAAADASLRDTGSPLLDAGEGPVDASEAPPDAEVDIDSGKLPGKDASSPGPDAGVVGLDASRPGPDASRPGLDASSPGLDASAPGLDAGPPCTAGTNTICGVDNRLHEGNCTNGFDDDGDGLVDDADPDCACNGHPPTNSYALEDLSGSATMIGCAGKVLFPARNDLCNTPGWTACSAQQVVARAMQAPTAVYWTSDLLQVSDKAVSGNCRVSASPASHFGSFNLGNCSISSAMRACPAVAGGDLVGNSCGVFGCSLAEDPRAPLTHYFGSCADSSSGPDTASTLCCKKLGQPAVCNLGALDDFGNNFMFGCLATASFSTAQGRCKANCHLCTAEEWVGRPRTQATANVSYYLASPSGGPLGVTFPITGGGCYVSSHATSCASGSVVASSRMSSAYPCGVEAPTPSEYIDSTCNDASGNALCCCP